MMIYWFGIFLLLHIFQPTFALLSCSSVESCTELQHQRCMDTDGDSQPDTCLCEAGYYLKVATCARLPEGQPRDPCQDPQNADVCKNGGTCKFNRDFRYIQCRCLPGFSGNTCDIVETAQGEVTEPPHPSHTFTISCEAGYYLREATTECVPCEVGFYKPYTGTDRCTPCPTTDEGHTLITVNTTSISQEQCVKGPSIRSFLPHYGPLAGGTLVHINISSGPGFQRSDLTEIKVARVVCQPQAREGLLNSESGFEVLCETAAVPEVKSGTVNLKMRDLEVISDDLYYYREDPIIQRLGRNKTILIGGLNLWVYGEHLDSVYAPIFVVTREKFNVKTTFESVCTVVSGNEMKCPIPNLVEGHASHFMPPLGSTGAQKNAEQTPGENVTSLTEGPTGGGRNKRSPKELGEPPFNNEWLHYWMGFRLDGVKRYRNVTDMFGELLVYKIPYLERLHDDPQDVYYFDYSKTKGFLQIKGRWLTYAATKEDYRVHVGVGHCNVSHLYENALYCLMPEDLPEPGLVYGEHDSPQVIVVIGNLNFSAGFITYHDPGSLPAQVVLGIILGVVAVVLLVASLAACLLIRLRHNKKKKNKNVNLETMHAQNANIYSNNNNQNQLGRYSASHNGYLQPINQRTPSRTSMSSGNSFTPLMIPMPGGGSEARTNRSASHGSINLFLDSTPNTPTTPNITQNVAYQVPRHNSIPFDIMDEISQDLKLIINECRVDSSRLSLKDSIGKGFFGKVYRGILKDESGKEHLTVAIKTVQGKECTVRDVEAFLAEAIVMKDFDHPNVINLLGVVIAGNRPFAILPYMEHGDLKSYISEPDRSIKVRELLGFGVQVAAGMEYLANQKIVHRDLATRNCMINKSLVVRIADFGLSRDIYKSDYYRVEDKHRPLPVKWMAIESLTGGVFTSSSDVWSFGVLLWELLTRGCSPYPDIDTFNLKTYLLAGRRLPQPEHAPDDVYALMYSCWEDLPENRSTFEQLHKKLAKIVEEEEENMTPEYLKLI